MMRRGLIIIGLCTILISASECSPDYPLPDIEDCVILSGGGCSCIYLDESYLLTQEKCAGFRATNLDDFNALLEDREGIVNELRACKREPENC